MQTQLSELENELAKMTDVNALLAQQKIEEEKKVTQLQAQVRYHKAEYQAAEENLNRFRTDCENKIREIREHSNAKIAKYALKTEEYQSAIAGLAENEINTHFDEINSLDAQIAELEQKYSKAQRQSLEKTLSTAKKRKNLLKKQLEQIREKNNIKPDDQLLCMI